MSATVCPIELPVRREINKLITEFVKSVGKKYHKTYSRPGKTQHNLKVCKVVLDQQEKTQLFNKLNDYNNKLHYIIDFTQGGHYNAHYYGGLTVRVFADAAKWREYLRQNEISVFGEHYEHTAPVVDQQSETAPSEDAWKCQHNDMLLSIRMDNDMLFVHESDQDCILLDGPITSEEMGLIDELRAAKQEIKVLRKALAEVEYHEHEGKLQDMIDKLMKRWRKVGIKL